jgi:cell wall-associated NlpC family hydrolase
MRAWHLGVTTLTLSVALSTASPAAQSSEPRNARILERVARIAESLRESKYNHATVVDEREGRYEFDCSGFVTWVLRRTAPGAHAALLSRSSRRRPLARDYYWEIARAPLGEKTPRGMRRISRIDEAEAGDIVAWLKPAELRSPHTGHVGFLLERPQALPDLLHAYVVRIADASSYQHDEDDRVGTGRTGFGSGVILLIADPQTGQPKAYGWFGRRSAYAFETSIALGRVTR